MLVEARRSDEFSYTPTEGALILRVPPTRVRQLLQDGELEGGGNATGHWLIPASAVHKRLEHLRRRSFLEAVGYYPSIVHAMQERAMKVVRRYITFSSVPYFTNVLEKVSSQKVAPCSRG